MEIISEPPQNHNDYNGAARRSALETWENIPAELKTRPQWVLWRREEKDGGGFTKVPISPIGWPINAHALKNWLSFEEAVDAYTQGVGDGIGFDLSADDPFCGIDL